MTTVASLLVLLGASIALLAGVGILRFSTTFARLHAAGKASPVAFLAAAAGTALLVDAGGAAQLGVAALALVLTLPVGVHLLLRAVHRTSPSGHLRRDDLAAVLTVDDLGRSS